MNNLLDDIKRISTNKFFIPINKKLNYIKKTKILVVLYIVYSTR